MQFNIRDLLLWTTIAAIYAAFAGALNNRGLLNYDLNIFSAILVILILLMPRFYDLLRQDCPLISFRQKGFYWYHIGPFGLIGLLVALAINHAHPLPLSTGILIALVLYHVFVEGLTRIVITQSGIGPQFNFLSWEDHRIEFDPNSNRIQINALSIASRKWGHPSTFIAIPTDRVEDVQAILEAKQEVAKETVAETIEDNTTTPALNRTRWINTIQFSIRDLLLWVTIAASYAACAGDLNSRGLLKPHLFPSKYIVIGAIAMFVLRDYFALIRSGPTYLSFKRKQSYREYVVSFCLPIAIAGMWIVQNESQSANSLIFFYLLMLISYVLGERITLGEIGLVHQSVFYSWKDYHFHFVPNTNNLRITSPDKWKHWNKTIATPTDRVEEVRAILEAKQGRNPLMNTNQR